MISGVKFVISQHALQTITNWPVKKRSKRLHKKLSKKRGPQFTTKPAAYVMADGRMVIHPALFDQLKARSIAPEAVKS